MRGIDFQIVRCLCRECGWFRIVGFCGLKSADRAVIRLRRDRKGDSNLLRAEACIGPAEASIEEIAGGREGFRDPEAEAYEMGLAKAEEQYAHLFEDCLCPRCKKGKALGLSWLRDPAFDLATYECWRLIRSCAPRAKSARSEIVDRIGGPSTAS